MNGTGYSQALSAGYSMGLSQGKSMGASMGASLGASMGASMGASLGASMGASLGASMGASMGVSQGTGIIDASSKKLRYYNQDPIRDPYAQISNSGFTPVGNLKTYGVANMYDRPEPTKLRDLRELYTVPYNTTPFLGQNAPSVKYIDTDSTQLRYPVFQNKKSAIDVSQITYHPQQVFINNPEVSSVLNNYYEQATTINLLGKNDYTYSSALDPDKVGLGQQNYGQNSTRFVNRWDVVDPRVVQNVDNIVMNVKNADGTVISLHQCGVSTRNELRNYVETNNC